MSNNYQSGALRAVNDNEIVLPQEATVALAELAGVARERLLALAVGTGLQVMRTMMAQEVTGLAGELEAEGLVARTAFEGDRRGVTFTITGPGWTGFARCRTPTIEACGNASSHD